LLEFLPALGQREAIAFGDGVTLPVRIKFDELPRTALPRSSTARFSEKWQKSVGDEGFLDQIVDRWRATHIGAGPDLNLAMFTEALDISNGSGAEADLLPRQGTAAFEESASRVAGDPGTARGALQQNRPGVMERRPDGPPRRETGTGTASRAPTSAARETVAAPTGNAAEQSSSALRSLREKLMQRSNPTR
jgi:hypothetical protein